MKIWFGLVEAFKSYCGYKKKKKNSIKKKKLKSQTELNLICLGRISLGYQFKKEGIRINHLMFMDDIKLYRRSTKEIDTLVQTVRNDSGDIRMEFGIKKCAHVNIQRGKVARTEGIQLPDGINIDETEYKYMGIIEGEEIKHQEMKGKIKKEYIKRLKAILQSKQNNSVNAVKAINSRAVSVIRYSAGIIDWKNSELCNMDRKTRKVLNMYQTLHPRSNVDWLYLPRSKGGKDLLSLEECVNAEKRYLGQSLKMNEDEWLRSAWEEGYIKEDEHQQVYKERTSKSRIDEYQNKLMHGQFLRPTKDLSINDTGNGFREGNSRKMPCSNKWYEQKPQPMTENENAKPFWDYCIRTDRVIPAHRPDLTLDDKTINKVSLIDDAVPCD